MNTIQTKRDVSFEIQHAVKTLGVSYRQIAEAANVGASTISRAARAGYKVNRSTHLAIVGAINHKLTLPHGVRCIAQPVDEDGVSFAQGHEISTEQLAQGLQDQVDLIPKLEIGILKPEFQEVKPFAWSRNIIAQTNGLVDDLLESAHSREKAELQKALAARIDELQAERAKSLDALGQLRVSENRLKAEREKNATQYESIGQCFAEIDNLKRLVALRTHDLSIYQKSFEDADNRAADAEYKVSELERDLTVQRAWTWFFVLLAFVAAVVGVVK